MYLIILILLLVVIFMIWVEKKKNKEQRKETSVTDSIKPIKADNLTKIQGIGPKISGILNEADIRTFNKLATTTVEQLKEILRNSDLRITPDPTTWPEQAESAVAGK